VIYLSKGKQQILHLINSDKSYEQYFFAKIESLEWFDVLKKEHYFEPQKFSKNNEGSILLPYSFDYLEKVSLQVSINPEYGEKLIDIIGDVVRYSREQEKLNNYYIWWYCVKILNNIPNAEIKKHLNPETFRAWLNEWTDRSSVQYQTIDDVGKNLLPKFLGDDSMILYAEAIIEVIIGIKASDQTKSIIGRKEADLIWDPYWLREAFKKNIEAISVKCSRDVIYKIADNLRSALEYQHESTWIDLEQEASLYQLRVSRIPTAGLKAGDIGYQQSVYECSIREYSPEEKKKVQNRNDLLAFRNIKPEIVVGKDFRFKAENVEEFVFEIKAKLPSEIDRSKIQDAEISKTLKGLNTDYSSIWFKNLSIDDPVSLHDAPGVLTSVLRDVLLSRCDLRKNEAASILKSLLSDKYPFPIFRRIILLCLDKHWGEYADLFDRFVELKPNVLAYSDCEAELQDILRNHNKEFSPEIKNKLKQLIEDVPKYYKEEGPKHIAYWKYKWLSPLKGNAEFAADYIEAKKRAEIKDDKPYVPDKSAGTFKWIGNISPLSVEDLLKMPIIDQIKYMREFKGADDWGRMENKPDKEGLANTLQAAVKEQPEKYLDDLGMFNQKGLYIYVNEIIRGFCDALKSGKTLQWKKILDFVCEYINQPWFIDEAFQAQGEDGGKSKWIYVWVVESVVDLIKEGSRDGERAISQDNFSTVEKLFDDIAKLIKGDSEPNIDRSALSFAINTTLGKVVESYIVFSLCFARVNKKQDEKWEEKKWGENRYERFLSKGNEPYTWLGRYLPNINYLDKEYAERKIEEISRLDVADIKWQSFMEGYLFGAYVYDDIYQLMRSHYIKALKEMPFEKEVDRRLVQHIALGYLRNIESLEKMNSDGQESLFFMMLTDSASPEKVNRWLEVANFFWSMTGKNNAKEEKNRLSDEMKEKILKFWAWTVKDKESIKTRLGEDYASFLGRMADLTILLPKIDENNEEWLMLSAAHIEARHHMTFFIDYLARYEDDESLKRIGKIYLKVLDGTTPTFRQEDIQLIVERLYNLKDKYPELKKDADDICNTYGRRGVHFLKELYEKNQ